MIVKYNQEIYINETSETKTISKKLNQYGLADKIVLFSDPIYLYTCNNKIEYIVISDFVDEEGIREVMLEKLYIDKAENLNKILEYIKKYDNQWQVQDK